MAAGMSDLDNLIHVLTAISILDIVCVCMSIIVHVHFQVHVILPVNRRLASMSYEPNAPSSTSDDDFTNHCKF